MKKTSTSSAKMLDPHSMGLPTIEEFKDTKQTNARSKGSGMLGNEIRYGLYEMTHEVPHREMLVIKSKSGRILCKFDIVGYCTPEL